MATGIFKRIKKTKWFGAFRSRVGRRGLFLAFIALLDSILGFSLAMSRIPDPEPFLFVTRFGFGIIWIITAFVCTMNIPIRRDRIAYSLAAMTNAAWGFRYVYLWYLGYPYAWISAVIWMCFSLTILVVSGWPEERVVVIAPEVMKE